MIYRCGLVIEQPKVGRLRLAPKVCRQRVAEKGRRCWRHVGQHDDNGRR